ncbi:MAG: hypothetical protein QMD77_02065 [Patescibacteria group bacterium]|nr:hypothetical protein [Patescibacteria group bacterium]
MSENISEKMPVFSKRKIVSEKTVNFLLILILGFLVGVAVKTEAKKRITIGYGDYLVANMKHDFDLMKPEPKEVPETQEAPGPAQEGGQNGESQGQ